MPGIVVTTLFAFITAWNEFFFALVILNSPDLTTLPLRLAQYVGIEGVVRFGPLAAAALLATLPSLLLFTIIQRWLTQRPALRGGQGLAMAHAQKTPARGTAPRPQKGGSVMRKVICARHVGPVVLRARSRGSGR